VVDTMWQTAKDMNNKYKETSEADSSEHVWLLIVDRCSLINNRNQSCAGW
jgi:hypothetical protein